MSSKNTQMSKNRRSEDIGVLLPRVYSDLCCCQESDNGSVRLKVVETTATTAMRIEEEGRDGDGNDKEESWYRKAKIRAKQVKNLRKTTAAWQASRSSHRKAHR